MKRLSHICSMLLVLALVCLGLNAQSPLLRHEVFNPVGVDSIDLNLAEEYLLRSPFFVRGFQRDRLVAVCLRHLDPAVPHSMRKITPPGENEARLQLLFFGNEPHATSVMHAVFCADSVQDSSASR